MHELDRLWPMKAHSAEVADLGRFVHDDAWVFEQKVDGIRALVKVVDGVAVAIGNSTKRLMDQRMCRLFEGLPWAGQWGIDAEWLDGVLWVFDLPVTPVSSTGTPFRTRRMLLEELARSAGWTAQTPVRLIPQARSSEDKERLWMETVRLGTEGVMAKALDARYEPGKRSWTTRKIKHVRTLDVVVTAWNPTKASIDVALWRDGELVPVGSCSWDDPRPPVGTAAEVRCLYLGEQGRLYQPIGMRFRPDKAPEDCTWDQLEGLSPNRTVIA
jgi:ATP-dependent DNA ligase